MFYSEQRNMSFGMRSSAISSWTGLSPMSVCVGVAWDTQVGADYAHAKPPLLFSRHDVG